ncbi:MAG: efflux RND transporter periplasmic adaptor subunit [Aeoliella sp.]
MLPIQKLLCQSRWVAAIGLFMAVAPAVAAGQAKQSPSTPIRIDGCRVKFADAISLASERAGVLAEVVAPGSLVAAGADVARLRDGVMLASRAIAEKEANNDIEVRFARKSAELAQLKQERALGANRTQPGTVSELELREIRLAAEKAHLQFEQAQHGQTVARLHLQEIEANLETLHMRAPFSAFVRSVQKQPGEVVQQGEIVAEVVNTSRVRVDGYAGLDAARYLRVGKSIELQLGEGEQAQLFPGVIAFVDVKIEPVSQRIRFAADVPNDEGQLREGLQATLLIPKQNTIASAPSTKAVSSR